LALRRFDRADSVFVPGTEGAQRPIVSPDGAWMAFNVGNYNTSFKKYTARRRAGTTSR
jgi:hypothetical protein